MIGSSLNFTAEIDNTPLCTLFINYKIVYRYLNKLNQAINTELSVILM
jgi:hypothetical protein